MSKPIIFTGVFLIVVFIIVGILMLFSSGCGAAQRVERTQAKMDRWVVSSLFLVRIDSIKHHFGLSDISASVVGDDSSAKTAVIRKISEREPRTLPGEVCLIYDSKVFGRKFQLKPRCEYLMMLDIEGRWINLREVVGGRVFIDKYAEEEPISIDDAPKKLLGKQAPW